MKTSTVLNHSLVLVALLVVSWAVAAPLQAAPENDDLKEELKAFLEQNPAIVRDLYPDLVNKASKVILTVDQDVVVDLLKKYRRELTVKEIEDEHEREAESEEGQEVDHERRKRQIEDDAGNSWDNGNDGSFSIGRDEVQFPTYEVEYIYTGGSGTRVIF